MVDYQLQAGAAESGGNWHKDGFGVKVFGLASGGSGAAESSSASSTAQDRTTFGAAVVSKTLDYMNGPAFGTSGAARSDYDFQKQVLGAYYSGRGTILDQTA